MWTHAYEYMELVVLELGKRRFWAVQEKVGRWIVSRWHFNWHQPDSNNHLTMVYNLDFFQGGILTRTNLIVKLGLLQFDLSFLIWQEMMHNEYLGMWVRGSIGFFFSFPAVHWMWPINSYQSPKGGRCGCNCLFAPKLTLMNVSVHCSNARHTP